MTEDGAPADDDFTVNLSDAHGHLALTPGGVASLDGECSEALTIVGSLAEVNATLAALTDTDFPYRQRRDRDLGVGSHRAFGGSGQRRRSGRFLGWS